jgi:uncharacterized protein YraI
MSRPITATLASAALVTLLACGSAAAVDAVTGTQLVMHVAPGAEHRSIATIPAETQVTVHGCGKAEGWCLVRFDGRLGWVEGESLNVVGFSRPSERAAAPPTQQVVLVPVPVAPEAVHPGFVTADDVIIGIDENVGLAAIGGRPALDLGKRHRGRLAFERHGFQPKAKLRQHGRFMHPHFDGRGFHAGKPTRFDGWHFGKAGSRFGKDLHVQRGHFSKAGGFVSRGKGFHAQQLHFGKPGRFVSRGKGGHGELRFGKAHAKWHIAKRGKGFGHVGKARFGGLRVKGGWRP